MYSDPAFLSLKPSLMTMGLPSDHFGESDDPLMNDIGNSYFARVSDSPHHDFPNLSVTRISPRISRSGTPEPRFQPFDRNFDLYRDLYLPSLTNLNNFEDQKL